MLINPVHGGGSGGGSITIEEIDGSPSISSVTTLKVNNASLIDLGGGVTQMDILVNADGGNYVDPYVASNMDVDGGAYV